MIASSKSAANLVCTCCEVWLLGTDNPVPVVGEALRTTSLGRFFHYVECSYAALSRGARDTRGTPRDARGTRSTRSTRSTHSACDAHRACPAHTAQQHNTHSMQSTRSTRSARSTRGAHRARAHHRARSTRSASGTLIAGDPWHTHHMQHAQRAVPAAHAPARTTASSTDQPG